MTNANPPHLKIIRPTSAAQRATRTGLDTILVTPELARAWQVPPFQRALRVNAKVRALAETIKGDDGVIPGILTIGVLERQQWLLDGQHRREAFLMSEVEEGYADIRMAHFETMGEMGEEFVRLNSQLVRMSPDDVLRGLEGISPALAKIRKDCPCVGYDQIRRGGNSPVVSMSALLRCWFGSAADTPSNGGMSALQLAQQTSTDDAEAVARFLKLALEAWGRDANYFRLWTNINLTICMWLYRRLVVNPHSTKTRRLTREQFERCLMSLSTDSTYLDWLVGRQLGNRDRSPAYARIKAAFVRRLQQDTGHKHLLPQPAWAGTTHR